MYIRVVFLKLGEIDTVKECFTAEAFIQAKWREPLLDYKAHDAVCFYSTCICKLHAAAELLNL